MTKSFRTKDKLTAAQLTKAWGAELAKDEANTSGHENNLLHILLEDIVNGRLDTCGPLRDGRRLGLRVITPDNKAGFIEGPQLTEFIRLGQDFALHRISSQRVALAHSPKSRGGRGKSSATSGCSRRSRLFLRK
jgi:hypothetical protein